MGTLRDQILTKDDLPKRSVMVPEWGVTVVVRTMTGRERDRFEEETLVKKGRTKEASLADIRARLVQVCACDSDGKQIFEPGDVAALTQKSAKALDRIFAVAKDLSGFSDEDIEDLAKNSLPAQNAGSGLS